MRKATKILMMIALILTSLKISAFAATIVSETKLNDGSYIRKCRFSNGVVDYCGDLDAVNAMRAFTDVTLTATPKQLAEMEKQEKEYNTKLEAKAQEFLSLLSIPAEQLRTLPNNKLEKVKDNVREAGYFVQDNHSRLSKNTQTKLNKKIAEYQKVIAELEEKQNARNELMEYVKDGIRTNVDGGFQAVQRFENATKIFDAFKRSN